MLCALVAELRDRGVVTSDGSVWRTVRDARLSFKKTLLATEQDRPDVAHPVQMNGSVEDLSTLVK